MEMERKEHGDNDPEAMRNLARVQVGFSHHSTKKYCFNLPGNCCDSDVKSCIYFFSM